MSSPNIHTPQKVAGSGQERSKMAKCVKKWPEVAGSGQKRPKMAKSGQKRLKVTKSSQNSQKIWGIQAFYWKKSPRNALKTLSLLAGSWIRTVHMMFNTVFAFSFGFFCLKKVWNGHFGQLIDRLREKNSAPFWTVSDRVGYTVLVGLTLWGRDGTVQNLIKFLRQIEKKSQQKFQINILLMIFYGRKEAFWFWWFLMLKNTFMAEKKSVFDSNLQYIYKKSLFSVDILIF